MPDRVVISVLPLRVGAVVLAVFLAMPVRGADDSLLDSISGQVRKIFADRQDAVVRVISEDAQSIRSGTGFFADPSGTIYTHAYIVFHADKIWAVVGDRKMPAKLLVLDMRSGVALLKVDYNSPFIPIGDAAGLDIASPVMLIGYPADLAATPGFGLVAGFDHQYLGKYFPTACIRANVPVQEGEGGSPLLNMKGEAVGILVGDLDGGSACHAVPIAAAEKLRMDYIRFGKSRHGWIGVHVEGAAEAEQGSKVRVARLDPDTPAAKSGLHEGDVLLQVGTVKISAIEDVLDASFYLTAGDTTEITVLRDGQPLEMKVKSAEDPGAPGVADASFPGFDLTPASAAAPSASPLLTGTYLPPSP